MYIAAKFKNSNSTVYSTKFKNSNSIRKRKVQLSNKTNKSTQVCDILVLLNSDLLGT